MPVSVNAIDHFVIRVTDLDAAEALYRRLGFALTPRGFHAGRGSANHTAPFSGGNYFELIHLPDGATRTRFTAIAEGPVAAVLRPADSRTIHAEFQALGYDVPEPRDLTRPVELPEGIRDARFITVDFPEIPPESVIFVTCEHLTPDLVWRPEWEDHPNGARRVEQSSNRPPGATRISAPPSGGCSAPVPFTSMTAEWSCRWGRRREARTRSRS